jgi:hypothetical protein
MRKSLKVLGLEIPLTTAIGLVALSLPPRFYARSCASASVTLLGAIVSLTVWEMSSV